MSMNSIPNHEYDRETEALLARRSREGDLDARDKLICSNIPFVEQLARLYLGRGVDYDDLFQEGCYGLMLAIERYDPEYGTLLRTYASSWIHKRLKMAIREQSYLSPIVPREKTYYEVLRYQHGLTTLTESLCRTPSDNELAEYLHTTPNQIRRIRLTILSFLSLDCEPRCYTYWTEINTVQNLLPADKLMPSAEEVVLASLNEPVLPSSDPRLTKREELALCRHLGFTESGKPETFREIAADTGWSLETIRRDYHSAICKLRCHLDLDHTDTLS